MHLFDLAREITASAGNEVIIGLIILRCCRQLWARYTCEWTEKETVDDQNNAIERKDYGGGQSQKVQSGVGKKFSLKKGKKGHGAGTRLQPDWVLREVVRKWNS